MLLQYVRVSSIVVSGGHDLARWLQLLKVGFLGLPVQNALGRGGGGDSSWLSFYTVYSYHQFTVNEKREHFIVIEILLVLWL